LEQLQEVLANLQELVGLGHERYQADRLVRWSFERLWVFAGNLADAYCAETGVPVAVEPWSELVAERNVLAHYLPDAITTRASGSIPPATCPVCVSRSTRPLRTKVNERTRR
jgi:hypothetical protein